MEKLRTAAVSLTKATAFFALYLLLQMLALSTVPREWRAALTLALLFPLLYAAFRLGLTGESREPAFSCFSGFTGWRRPPFAALPVCLILGAGLNIALSALLTLIELPSGLTEAYTEASSALTSGGTVMTISTVLVTPLLEETVYRGLLLSRLRSGLPASVALVLSAAVFGLMHGDVIWTAYAFISGLLLGAVYYATDSVAACAVTHMGFNGISYLLMMLTLPEWVMGIPALSVGVILTALSLLGISTASAARRRKMKRK